MSDCIPVRVPRPSRLFTSAAATGFAALFVFGCGAKESAICDRYIACVNGAAPGMLGEVLSVYGHDGACWKSLSYEACESTCQTGLESLGKLPNAVSACSSGTDAMNPGTDPGPQDPTQPLFAWPFPTKPMYYTGTLTELPLGEIDPATGAWGCTRDDQNANPSSAVVRMGEPNDDPEHAIVLPNPLPADLPSTSLGASYQICPDPSAAKRPDYDVYKFRLLTPGKVIGEIRYAVGNGDLDLAIFRLDTEPGTGKQSATLITADMTARDNACIESNLQPGTYFAVVRGAVQTVGGATPRHATAMNDYRLRIFTVDMVPYSCK